MSRDSHGQAGASIQKPFCSGGVPTAGLYFSIVRACRMLPLQHAFHNNFSSLNNSTIAVFSIRLRDPECKGIIAGPLARGFNDQSIRRLPPFQAFAFTEQPHIRNLCRGIR